MHLNKFLFALLAVTITPISLAQTIPNAPHIVVNGHAERTVKPDKFELPITVSIDSKDPATAAKVQQKTAALVLQLKNAGITDADLEVDNLRIDKNYDDDSHFTGNAYQQAIRAKFHDKKQLVSFLKEIKTYQDVEIGTITRSLKDVDLIKLALLKEAVENSKQRAESLATLYGLRVLGVHKISMTPISGDESYGSRTLDRVQVTGTRIRRVDAEGKQPAEQVIEEGTIDVSEDIYAVFLIGK